MGKSVFKLISAVALVASFIVPGGIFLSGGLLGTSFIGVSFATILQTVAAVTATIGFSEEFDLGDSARQLAENLHVNASPVAVRSVVFGRSGIAGQILFRENIENSGDTPDEILIILGLAGYPATSLEKFWFNGELVFDGESTTGPGAITSGKFANDLWVWFRTGEETTAAFPDIAALSSTWAAKTRKLRGIPAIGIRLKVTEKVEGRLEPLAQIKGAKLYDPRLDSTVAGGAGTHRFDDPATWAWSENPKLAELLYLRGAEVNGVRIFGAGKPKEAIDLANFASEANICEEQIAVVGGGTINRYTCNGILIPAPEHAPNLRKLLTASAGTMDASTGIYRTFAGAWRAPSMPLTEADIDGAPRDMLLQINPSDEVNVIQGSFADPLDRWQVKEYPERRDDDSIAKVGENPVTIDLPFTTDHRTAQRIVKIEMLRRNARRAFGANFWLRTIPLQPGDIVTQTYARYGINAETFRVNLWGLEAAEDDNGNRRLTVPMQFVEEKQSWFDWDETTEEKSTPTLTSMPTVDRNPKLITLEGTTTFEGPFPPANPKVGWLWRDTDTNILFRWNGSAWIDYATETKTADQIDYLAGASVESLQPGEAGADQTTPRITGNVLINPGFETGTLTGWTQEVGTWVAEAVEPRHGAFSAKGTPSAGVARLSNNSRLQVEEGDRVFAGIFVQREGSGSADTKVGIVWRDNADAIISIDFGNTVTGIQYLLSRKLGVAPAGAVTAQFRVEMINSTGPVIRADGAMMSLMPRGADLVRLHEHSVAGPVNVSGSGGIQDDVVATFNIPLPGIPGTAKVEAHFSADDGQVAGSQKSSIGFFPDVSSAQGSQQTVFVPPSKAEQSVRGVFTFGAADSNADVRLQWFVQNPAGPNDATYTDILLIVEVIPG